MTYLFDVSRSQPRTRSSVVALHCSLGSGRQWTRLAAQLGSYYQFIAPDLSGYGNPVCAVDLPMTLAQEVEFLSDRIGERRERSIWSATPMVAQLRSGSQRNRASRPACAA
jgi:hypothetical protein